MARKNNPLSDGKENAEQAQQTGQRLNMPAGAKKPKNTSK